MTTAPQTEITLAVPRDVDEAITSILFETLGSRSLEDATEVVAIEDAAGRILAEDIQADRDQPPFNRAAMDGIAVRGDLLIRESPCFQSVGVLAAGGDPLELDTGAMAVTDSCIEIMTGAPVPPPYDTVVRYEDLAWEGSGDVRVTRGTPQAGGNVHRRGSDYRQGDCLGASNVLIGSGVLSVLASCGYDRVTVRRQPRIAVVATGDELAPVAGTPKAHQIRASNPVTLAAELRAWGFPPTGVTVVGDDPEAIRETVGESVNNCDVLVISGAVSKGKYDSVPDVLRDLGAKIHIHGVRQRPGKPLLIGRLGSTLVLGLPGNPVSALVSLRRYLIPQLCTHAGDGRTDGGDPQPTQSIPELGVNVRPYLAQGFAVPLSSSLEFPKRLTWYPTLALRQRDDGPEVDPVWGNGSGDFSQLARSSGFGVVDESVDRLNLGDTIWFYPWG